MQTQFNKFIIESNKADGNRDIKKKITSLLSTQDLRGLVYGIESRGYDEEILDIDVNETIYKEIIKILKGEGFVFDYLDEDGDVVTLSGNIYDMSL